MKLAALGLATALVFTGTYALAQSTGLTDLVIETLRSGPER